MTKESKLLKNTAIIAIGNICTKCISFFMLPLYTSILSTIQYGTVDLISTYTSLVIIILTLQFEQGVFRFLIESRNNLKKQKQYISTTIISLLVINIPIGLILAMILSYLKYQYTFYVVSIILIGVCISVLLQIPRGLGNNITYATGSCISGSLNVILNVIFIAVLNWRVEGMLVATILAQGFAAIYIAIKLKIWKYVRISLFQKEDFIKLLKFSAPLIPNTFCWWVVNASDRVIIKAFINVAANGIYSVACKFPTIFNMVTNIFQLSWTESASENIGDKDSGSYMKKIMQRTIRLYSSANIGIIAVMPFLFNILIGKDFIDAYNYIPLLMTGAFFQGVANLYGSIYTAYKMTKEIAKTTILAAILNILINVILVKRIGIYAAAISTVLAYFTITIVRHIDINKKIKMQYNKGYLISESVVYIIIFYAYYSKNIKIEIIALVLLIPYCVKQNYGMLKMLMNSMFGKFMEKIRK